MVFCCLLFFSVVCYLEISREMSKNAPHIPYHNDVTADFVGALSNTTRFSFPYFLEQFENGECITLMIVMGFVGVLALHTTVYYFFGTFRGYSKPCYRSPVMVTNWEIAWTIGSTW